MGRVARAHGIRGRVLIAPYNADSEGLERVRRMWLGEREFEVERAERVFHTGKGLQISSPRSIVSET